MPLLGALLSTLFTALGGFLLKMFIAKVAIRAAAVVAITAAGAALMATFNQLIAPLVAAAFSTTYGQFLGLAFPPVAGTCIAAFTAVWGGCMTYKLQVRAISVTAGL
jgi:hypothetical protein